MRTCSLVLLLCVIGLTASCATANSETPTSKSITASEGIVSATFSYTRAADSFGEPTFSDLKLGITRSATSYYEQPVKSRYCGSECWAQTAETAPVGSSGPLAVKDLDQDGSPEVILDLYTGGAHCCAITQVFSFDPGTMTYRLTEHNFGDPGAVLVDLTGNGQLDFESADDRFAYQFTSYAYSGLPRQVWRFHEGRFVDVTREFPRLIAVDAKRQFKQFLANRGQGLGLGFIAAWSADEYLLGHQRLVSGRLAREARLHHLRSDDRISPSGQKFVGKLMRFLKMTGYA